MKDLFERIGDWLEDNEPAKAVIGIIFYSSIAAIFVTLSGGNIGAIYRDMVTDELNQGDPIGELERQTR